MIEKNKEAFEKMYKMLNLGQKKAVDTINGPVFVMAGPGTGKTQMLTLRITNILNQNGISPDNILALTFTNAGVIAMRKRLADFIGTEFAYKVGIFTFHSFADEQIRTFPEVFKKFAFARPMTDIEKIKIVEDILKNNTFKGLKTFSSDFHYTRDIIGAIDDLKSNAVTVKDFEKSIVFLETRILEDEGENAFYKVNRGVNKKGDIKKTLLTRIKKQEERQKDLTTVYEMYQEKLDELGLYDFSDMILSVVTEAEKNHEFRTSLQDKYEYILVDEHQDTNDAQSKLIEILAGEETREHNPNIFTVGDEKQAIYRFQGASLDNFLKFKNKYNDIVQINLEENYRSSQRILDSAHALLPGEISLKAKNNAYANEKSKINLTEFSDYKSELVYIAEEIKAKIESGINPNEIAIFYKENKSLFEVRNILEKFSIPFKISSKENILDNVEIKKMILLLKAINNPLDDEILAKVLFINFLQFDVIDILKILEKLNHRGKGAIKNKSIFKIISSEDILAKLEISEPKKFIKFAFRLKSLKKLEFELNFISFFEEFSRKSGFLNHIFSLKDNVSAIKRYEKIFDEIKNQFFTEKEYNLNNFITYIDILDKYQLTINIGGDDLIDGVNLMTAHGSKGLEFEYVYIINFIDSIWGGKRRRGEKFNLPINKIKGDVDDERRLFYVALTRGKRQVNISYSNFDFDGREKIKSRFLEEIDNSFFTFKIIESEELVKKSKKYFGEKTEKVLSFFDKKYIKKLFLENSFSVSALNNYYQSPIKYFFKNLIKLPTGQVKSLIFGNVVHDSLDLFFDKSVKNGGILTKENFLELYHESLDKFFILEKDFAEIEAHGEDILDKYYEKYRNEMHLNVETEKKAVAEIELKGGEKIVLFGIIDKIETMECGGLRVVDYKTGKTYDEKTKDQKKDLDRQLVFYKLLIDKYLGKEVVKECMLDFLEKNKKTGEYVRRIKKISSEEVAELENDIKIFAVDIMSGEFLNRKYKRNKDNEEFWELWNILKKVR